MDGLIENIKIAGIASCVPRHTEDNMDYGNVLGEKRVKKQVKLLGYERDIPAELNKEHRIWQFVQPMICLQN